LFIEPGSPWENGYVESFNGKLRDELLARELFDTLLEAKVLINEGNNLAPAFAKPQQILSQGKPIRIFMSQVYPGIKEYSHNMGYPFPSYVDWDTDGLPDLMLPNITNRIFWYKNIGTRQQPTFGPRRQVIVDGYPETPASLVATAKLLGAETKQWVKRPPDTKQPFGWRQRASFGDLDGDGRPDLLAGCGYGNYAFYRRTPLEMKDRPKFQLGQIRLAATR